MILAHVSDNHGDLPPIDFAFDAIVVSGDFQKTKGRRAGERIRPRAEHAYQERWCRKKRAAIEAWTRGKPLLFCPGNHDFYPCARDLAGDVLDLALRVVTFGGLRFFGFPFVPWIDGEWAYELRAPEMRERVAEIPSDVDVLVAHCPPYGILDMEQGQHFGNTSLANRYAYSSAPPPRAILCGHIHASYGVTRWHGIVVVNSATGVQRVEVM